MGRRPTTFLLSIAILITAVVGAFSAPAGARAAVDLRICGTVNVYVPATALLPGTLIVGPSALVIAAGTDLSSDIAVGENLCFSLDLDASGRITDATVTANVSSTLDICGVITAYTEADADSTGSLTIGGRTFVLAAGSNLPASVDLSADLCLHLTLNGFGQISAGTAQANVSTTVNICGVVTAFADATATSTGSLRIAGRTFVLAAGSNLPASVDVGANLCLTLTLNAIGQVSGGSAQANVTSSVEVCGVVTALAEATSTSLGSLAIGGRSFVLALGSNLPASVEEDANLCLTLTVNAIGQVSSAGVQANVTTTVEVCGQVTAYAAATATSNGSLTIGGVTRPIAAGVTLSPQVEVGAYLRLRLTVDVFGRVADDVVLDVGATLSEVCGAGATPAPSGTADPSATADPSGSADPSATADPSGSADPSASPSSSGIPGAGSAGPSASPGPGDDGSPGGGGSSDNCQDDGTAAAGGSGGILPDTASLGRAARVLGMTAIPLLFALLGLLAFMMWNRRRASAGMDAEEVTR